MHWLLVPHCVNQKTFRMLLISVKSLLLCLVSSTLDAISCATSSEQAYDTVVSCTNIVMQAGNRVLQCEMKRVCINLVRSLWLVFMHCTGSCGSVGVVRIHPLQILHTSKYWYVCQQSHNRVSPVRKSQLPLHMLHYVETARLKLRWKQLGRSWWAACR